MVWVIEGILAVVFLCWFGNAMADKYRGLYGVLPRIHEPEPKYPVNTVSRTDYEDSACTAMCSASGTFRTGNYAQVFRSGEVDIDDLLNIRPGGIVRLR